MTDIPANGPIDPEEYAEDVVTGVFGRRLITTLVTKFLMLLNALVLVYGAKVFAVIALWHVPQWAIGIVVSVLAADLIWDVVRTQRHVRRERANERAAGTNGTDAITMGLAQARADLAAHKLRLLVRKPTWWIHHVLDGLFIACVGVVFAHWFHDVWVGAAVAGGWAALVVLLRLLLVRMMPHTLALVGFTDATAPKDTPEI